MLNLSLGIKVKKLSKTVFVNKVPVSCVSFEEVLEEMQKSIFSRAKPQHISITNTESMYFAKKNSQHAEYIHQARFSLCDGIGVVLPGFLYGYSIPRRNGPILMLESFEYGLAQGWRHFFLGGREGVAKELADKMKQRYPGLKVAGTFCPPFRELTQGEEEKMLQNVNQSQADILWVGLGLPKQEKWIAHYKDRLNIPWTIGVGAAFDYHTGNAKWAPPFLQKIGMEWFYRLLNEPRMFVRNVRSFQFMFSACAHAVFSRVKNIHKEVEE
jgi:N-acetylglucosaminyldiphosphoundecaprenol N-acetyl-beta-D-mannosaminyltransferase